MARISRFYTPIVSPRIPSLIQTFRKCSPSLRYSMKHKFNFLTIKFSSQNSAFSFSFFKQIHFSAVCQCVRSCGAVSGTSRTHIPTLRKLTSNINLFQLKGQDLTLSNDMHIQVLLQMTSIRSAILITPRGV